MNACRNNFQASKAKKNFVSISCQLGQIFLSLQVYKTSSENAWVVQLTSLRQSQTDKTFGTGCNPELVEGLFSEEVYTLLYCEKLSVKVLICQQRLLSCLSAPATITSKREFAEHIPEHSDSYRSNSQRNIQLFEIHSRSKTVYKLKLITRSGRRDHYSVMQNFIAQQLAVIPFYLQRNLYVMRSPSC